MISRRRLLALGPAAALRLVIEPEAAWAATPTEQMRGFLERAVVVLGDPALRQESRADDRREALRSIAADMFDIIEMTKRCLGPHWQTRTPDERKEIVVLVSGLIELSYMSKIELYSGEQIAFAGETVDGDQATVRTRVLTRQGNEIPVAYQMLRRAERWWVYDVTIEAVSLVANYRSQFNRIIQGHSYSELVRRLRAKLDNHASAATARVKRTSQE